VARPVKLPGVMSRVGGELVEEVPPGTEARLVPRGEGPARSNNASETEQGFHRGGPGVVVQSR